MASNGCRPKLPAPPAILSMIRILTNPPAFRRCGICFTADLDEPQTVLQRRQRNPLWSKEQPAVYPAAQCKKHRRYGL